MKNFGIGLALGLAGLGVWVGVSVFGGILEGVGETSPSFVWPLMVLGFTIMFVGPLTFWIILPVTRVVRRRRQ